MCPSELFRGRLLQIVDLEDFFRGQVFTCHNQGRRERAFGEAEKGMTTREREES